MYLNCLFRFISFLTSLDSVVLCLNHSLVRAVNQIPCPSLSPVLWKNPNPIWSSCLLTLCLNMNDSAWLEKNASPCGLVPLYILVANLTWGLSTSRTPLHFCRLFSLPVSGAAVLQLVGFSPTRETTGLELGELKIGL